MVAVLLQTGELRVLVGDHLHCLTNKPSVTAPESMDTAKLAVSLV